MRVSENWISSSPASSSPAATHHGHGAVKGVKSMGCKELALHSNSVLDAVQCQGRDFFPLLKDREGSPNSHT